MRVPKRLDQACGPCRYGQKPTPIPSLPLPTPIPEIDAKGDHNVPPAPYTEPSEIFNFRGRVATAILAGWGRDNAGHMVRFGGPGTDVRFMQGEYVTEDGEKHYGTFIHL
ncbi:hypothetical protein [Sulfobacillus thermosulfidooxidans]|uniref:Uncharacterized protein n=2 Tax=Sulfobacillus thermosulfidooxidans TaxID=28034 RepID=A0A1W1WJH2_SULTA|nr:hypothetical protein [Sulfobacillus thermosulfidooxidans]OLZ10290.1 hypothetical protein BFX05_10395 [Sulfobacillus thermosulfidooxidans]OLZ13273.1 hypothetical protein BFX06_12150 [Sulfobacillus thermosulfidooxidans]OLZ21653.1 hypothetical protein BFX07_12575 [Sulfobacillus thermosulfidooxidans]PSR22192.1 MAG: hypothetical protein C7B47_16800 [Sulfobacillus thermosulfidooxidans]SMC05903.1 hypothetical protein SAMN00768000_2522 [Sulfobacillus thermosulfidooxidans DSM 9293]